MFPMWLLTFVILAATTFQFIDNYNFFNTLPVQRGKYELDYASSSASDAAIQEMQSTSQLTRSGNTYVDPEFLWTVYKYTFLRSLAIQSNANMQRLETSFPAVVIAVNDGYYMRLLVDEQGPHGTTKNYRFTQKLPYARTTQVATTTTGDQANLPLDGVIGHENIIPAGTVISDTMDGTNITAYKSNLTASTGAKRQYQTYEVDGNKLKSSRGSAHDLIDINKMLLEAIDYSMFYNGSSSSSKNTATLTVPDQVSEGLLSPSVSFVGPTIFALSDSLTFRGRTYFNYYSVGGSQIVQAETYYCYTRNGEKLYSTLNPTKFLGADYSTIEQVYRSAKEAAEHGYSPDPIHY